VGGATDPLGVRVLHPRVMTHLGTTAEAGDLVVPLLTGWQSVAAAVLLVVLLVVAASVVGVARSGRSDRSEWQAYLDGRTAREDAGDRQP